MTDRDWNADHVAAWADMVARLEGHAREMERLTDIARNGWLLAADAAGHTDPAQLAADLARLEVMRLVIKQATHGDHVVRLELATVRHALSQLGRGLPDAAEWTDPPLPLG